MDEPLEIGTLVEARLSIDPEPLRTTFLRANNGQQPWLEVTNLHPIHTVWKQLIDPVILHEGYTPPTPEPTGQGAVARYYLASGSCVLIAIDDADDDHRRWTFTDGSGWRHWSDLPQPVEVLYEGVAE